MTIRNVLTRIWLIAHREMHMFSRRPMFLFSMLIVPVTSIFLFTTVMGDGLPVNLPAGLVDEDNTVISRSLVRTLDAMAETDLVARYPSFHEARQAMQRGEIYAFYHIPKGTTCKALSQRQPSISFYTNETYFLPSAMLMKEMYLSSELISISVNRSTMTARGNTLGRAMAATQPIVLETHPLGNPWISYAILLCNVILPCVLILCVLLSTSYTIGMEWKMETHLDLYRMGNHNPAVILMGKLLPQTLLYMLIFLFMDVYLYKILCYPCHCAFINMVLVGWLTVFAAQGMAIFVFALFPGMMRFSMSVCSLIGVVSMSISGYSYPTLAMDRYLQYVVNIFPVRHYYLIYVNQALNGYSIVYVWANVAALTIFMLLPVLVLRRYNKIFTDYSYRP